MVGAIASGFWTHTGAIAVNRLKRVFAPQTEQHRPYRLPLGDKQLGRRLRHEHAGRQRDARALLQVQHAIEAERAHALAAQHAHTRRVGNAQRRCVDERRNRAWRRGRRQRDERKRRWRGACALVLALQLSELAAAACFLLQKRECEWKKNSHSRIDSTTKRTSLTHPRRLVSALVVFAIAVAFVVASVVVAAEVVVHRDLGDCCRCERTHIINRCQVRTHLLSVVNYQRRLFYRRTSDWRRCGRWRRYTCGRGC